MIGGQIFSMIARMLTRRAVNWGVRKGMARMSGAAKTQPRGKVTPAAAKRDADMRKAVKRARQAARVTRRLGR
ncbi:hypothetical protein [uncultured Paracoccus sp.]|uniref:hypothetical protein n=1 Tax=uncultured Paracoccus sp. TaxID=189685 RepID=UPI00263211A7|nr:hypothetical protein [uncultured Paracoccus sp.]